MQGEEEMMEEAILKKPDLGQDKIFSHMRKVRAGLSVRVQQQGA